MLAHGMETVFYGILFYAALFAFGLGIISVVGARSSRASRSRGLFASIVTILVSMPLLFIAALAVFSNDPTGDPVFTFLTAALVCAAFLLGCVSLSLWLSRRRE